MNGITEENLRILNARHRIAVLIIAGEILAVLAMLALSFRQLGAFTQPADERTVTTLWMSVLFLAGGSFLLRRMFNSWERLSNAAVLGGVSGLTSKLLSNSAITSLLGALAATVGFVISQITGDPMDMVRAAAIAFVVFFANFPRKSSWRAVVARLRES